MKIARRLFVVPLAANNHGKTTLIKALVSQGGEPQFDRLTKGHRALVSPWGREIDAYVFGRSFQETEKGNYETIIEALDANDAQWRERELIIFPSHAETADALAMIQAAQSAGFDAICAAIIMADRDREALSEIWELNWDERWSLPNPKTEHWQHQVNTLGCDLWAWICRTLAS